MHVQRSPRQGDARVRDVGDGLAHLVWVSHTDGVTEDHGVRAGVHQRRRELTCAGHAHSTLVGAAEDGGDVGAHREAFSLRRANDLALCVEGLSLCAV